MGGTVDGGGGGGPSSSSSNSSVLPTTKELSVEMPTRVRWQAITAGRGPGVTERRWCRAAFAAADESAASISAAAAAARFASTTLIVAATRDRVALVLRVTGRRTALAERTDSDVFERRRPREGGMTSPAASAAAAIAVAFRV